MNFTFRIFTLFLFSLFWLGTASAASFTDVGPGNSNLKAIEFLKDEGVIIGYPDLSFQPDRSLNRAELTKIVVESAGYPLVEDLDCFPDVPMDEWYAPYVCTAFAQGVVQGYPDGTFKPTDLIRRAEAVKIIVEANKLFGEIGGRVYSDVPVGEWYEEYVDAALASNLLLFDGSFKPSYNVTRGDFSGMYYRVLNLDDDVYGQVYDNFSIDESIPEKLLKGEVFVVSGVSFKNDLEIDISFGNESEKIGLGDTGDRFEVPLYFESEGIYDVEIGGEKLEVRVVDDFKINDSSIEDDSEFEVFLNVDFSGDDFENMNVNLNSDFVTGGFLQKFEFSDSGKEFTIVNRQSRSLLNIDEEWLRAIWSGDNEIELEFSIAKFEDGARSEFKTLESIELEIAYELETIVNNLNGFDLDFSYGLKDPISVTFTPDNLVDPSLLVMNQKFDIAKIEDFVKEIDNGNWIFEYVPSFENDFVIIEVNDDKGSALLNYPVYRHNVLPFEADPFLLAESSIVDVSVDSALELLNDDRNTFGVANLKLDEDLNKIAEAHLADMLENDFVAHAGSDGRKVDTRKLDYGVLTFVSENIARDRSLSAAQSALMRSASHRINILDASWEKVGIAVFEDNESGAVYLVQNFGIDNESIDVFFDELIEGKISGIEKELELGELTRDWADLMREKETFEKIIDGRKLIDGISDLGVYSNGVTITGTTVVLDEAGEMLEKNLDDFVGEGFTGYSVGLSLDESGVIYYAVVLVK